MKQTAPTSSVTMEKAPTGEVRPAPKETGRCECRGSRGSIAATPMTSKVVNLNRFRKEKRREAEARQAEVNRVRHGRTKAERERELVETEREITERERAARLLEGKRLAPVDDAAATTAVGVDDRPAADPAPPGRAPRP